MTICFYCFYYTKGLPAGKPAHEAVTFLQNCSIGHRFPVLQSKAISSAQDSFRRCAFSLLFKHLQTVLFTVKQLFECHRELLPQIHHSVFFFFHFHGRCLFQPVLAFLHPEFFIGNILHDSCRQTHTQTLQPHLFFGHALSAERAQPFHDFVQCIGKILYSVNEEHGCCGGCLHTGMSHKVQHGLVSFVPEPHEHRQRKLCAVGCQFVGIEARQIRSSSSAANQNHNIPKFLFFVDSVQGTDNAVLCALTLHQGREQPDV